jgi:hypothetical protein
MGPQATGLLTPQIAICKMRESGRVPMPGADACACAFNTNAGMSTFSDPLHPSASHKSPPIVTADVLAAAAVARDAVHC